MDLWEYTQIAIPVLLGALVLSSLALEVLNASIRFVEFIWNRAPRYRLKSK